MTGDLAGLGYRMSREFSLAAAVERQMQREPVPLKVDLTLRPKNPASTFSLPSSTLKLTTPNISPFRLAPNLTPLDVLIPPPNLWKPPKIEPFSPTYTQTASDFFAATRPANSLPSFDFSPATQTLSSVDLASGNSNYLPNITQLGFSTGQLRSAAKQAIEELRQFGVNPAPLVAGFPVGGTSEKDILSYVKGSDWLRDVALTPQQALAWIEINQSVWPKGSPIRDAWSKAWLHIREQYSESQGWAV
jgi:hypothetical protein